MNRMDGRPSGDGATIGPGSAVSFPETGETTVLADAHSHGPDPTTDPRRTVPTDG